MNNIALILKKLKISTLVQNCCNFLLIKISSNWRFPGYFQLNFSKIDMAPFRPKTITMLTFSDQFDLTYVFADNLNVFAPRGFFTRIGIFRLECQVAESFKYTRRSSLYMERIWQKRVPYRRTVSQNFEQLRWL